jgi:hypothetical protein
MTKERKMKIRTRIAKLEGSVREKLPAGKLLLSGRTPAQVDEELFREQLERVIENKRTSLQLGSTLNPQTAETGVLLKALGYTNDEEGRQNFLDAERVWISLRKHALELPHLCAEFCPMGTPRLPHSKREYEFYYADIERHFDWLQPIWRSPFMTAIALYDYVERRGMGGLPELLAAFDRWQHLGKFPEVIAGKISEIVVEFWEEWRMPKEYKTPYLVDLNFEKINAFFQEHQATEKSATQTEQH